SSGFPAAVATAARVFIGFPPDPFYGKVSGNGARCKLVRASVAMSISSIVQNHFCGQQDCPLDLRRAIRDNRMSYMSPRYGAGMAGERQAHDPLVAEVERMKGRPKRNFIHLRVHSAYSLLEGALPLGKIINHALNDEAPAIAIADTNNLFGARELAQKASKEGVQPIIGCQLAVAFNDVFSEARRSGGRKHTEEYDPLVLIAATEPGYRNLVRLVSRAYLDNEAGAAPHAATAWLAEHADGIICLTGGPRGPVGTALKADRAEIAEARLLFLKETFGDRLYVELERLADYDRALEAVTVELAYQHDLPLVATNEAFFPAREDFDAHDALIAIAEGTVIAADDRRRLTPDNYLKTQAEMAALFADLPEALDNTVEIALRCSYYPKTRAPILPRFTGGGVADADAVVKAEAEELRRQAREGLEKRLQAKGVAEGHSREE